MTLSPVIAPVIAPVDNARIQAGVARMRAAQEDGSLHHHRPEDIPGRRRSHAIDIVRAWAAGEGIEAQRRLCRVCSSPSVPPRPRDAVTPAPRR